MNGVDSGVGILLLIGRSVSLMKLPCCPRSAVSVISVKLMEIAYRTLTPTGVNKKNIADVFAERVELGNLE